MKITRTTDMKIPRTDSPGAINPQPLLGRWLNTNPQTTGIKEVVLATGPTDPTLRVIGAGEAEPLDWGTVPLELFLNCEEEDGRPAVAALATYELDFMTARLQIRYNRGVLVIAQFTEFKDDSGRSNYFHREFFSRYPGD